MNGRKLEENTPEARLAAVARSLMIKMESKYLKSGVGPKEPDYADFREALRPYVRRELLLARIDEARKTAATAITSRVKELAAELHECEKLIPKEDRL
jgi:hypothetical protein